MVRTNDGARGIDPPENARWSALLESLEDLYDRSHNISMHADATVEIARRRDDGDAEAWVTPALAWLRRDIAEMDRRIDAAMQILDSDR